jgi:hypothetical protein
VQKKLFKWREAITSKYGPEPLTRLILLTLSLHMNQSGGSCFPSIKTLMQETGLGNKAVIRHIRLAEKTGWIRKEICGFSGQGWKRHSYKAKIPPNILSKMASEGGVRKTPRSKKGGVAEGKGGVTQDQKVVSQRHTNSSYNSSNKYSPDSIEIGLSNLLFKLILSRNLKFKKPNIENWAKHIDLAIRRDQRTPQELEKVILWCQGNSFWRNNILSTEKLRDQFDRLFMQMEDEKDGKARRDNPKGHEKPEGKSGPGKYDGIEKTLPSK